MNLSLSFSYCIFKKHKISLELIEIRKCSNTALPPLFLFKTMRDTSYTAELVTCNREVEHGFFSCAFLRYCNSNRMSLSIIRYAQSRNCFREYNNYSLFCLSVCLEIPIILCPIGMIYDHYKDMLICSESLLRVYRLFQRTVSDVSLVQTVNSRYRT